jgi:hypothetical protein
MQSKARTRLVALGLALGGASGCAAGAGTAPSAKSALEPEPSTVEEAQAQLAQGREQIEGPTSAASGAGGAALTESPPAAPASVSPSAAPESGQKTREDACAVPCRAIASMRRAVDAICRIAGAQDTRCVEARKTLSDDEARVARCGC